MGTGREGGRQVSKYSNTDIRGDGDGKMQRQSEAQGLYSEAAEQTQGALWGLQAVGFEGKAGFIADLVEVGELHDLGSPPFLLGPSDRRR